MSIINTVLAADTVDITGLEGVVSTELNLHSFTNLNDLLSNNVYVNLINTLFIFVGIIFFFNLILAGWDYMLSSGDPKKISAATTRLLNSFIGILMVFTAFVVVRLITTMLGLGTVAKPLI